MNVHDATFHQLQAALSGDADRPASPEEAAEQFEEVLVRQFVRQMTDGLFDASLTGDGGPQWMNGYSRTQQEALTDALTKHLVESGTLRLKDMLLRQWQPPEEAPAEEAPTSLDRSLAADNTHGD